VHVSARCGEIDYFNDFRHLTQKMPKSLFLNETDLLFNGKDGLS